MRLGELFDDGRSQRRRWLSDCVLPAAGELGDVLCSADDATRGAAAVENLVSVWSSTGQPQKFSAEYTAIVSKASSLQRAASSTGSDTVSLSLAFCDWKDLGTRADALVQRIGAATGQDVGPPVQQPSTMDSVLGAARTAAGITAVLGLGYLAVRGYEAYAARPSQATPRRRRRR